MGARGAFPRLRDDGEVAAVLRDQAQGRGSICEVPARPLSIGSDSCPPTTSWSSEPA